MKALLKNQTDIVAIFLTTLLFIGTFSAGYIQAQNVGEPITLEIVPVSERTPQVRDAIVAAVPGVDAAADVTETHLAAITALSLVDRNITSLKSGDFDGLTGLEELLLYGNQLTSLPEDIFSGLPSLRTLRFGLNQIISLPDGLFDGLTTLTDLRMIGNQLTSLPDGIFEGLTGLTQLRLGSNAVNPLPLTVSLEKVAAGQFKAVAPTGAPFNIVLPLYVTNGTINGRRATTITIPAGSVESDTLTVTRTPGTIWSVFVDSGTLPNLPGGHSGYTLVKSDDLPLEVIRGYSSGPEIWSGTVTGGSWGNDFGNGNATGYGYSRHHNAGSISIAPFDIVLLLNVRNGLMVEQLLPVTRTSPNFTYQRHYIYNPWNQFFPYRQQSYPSVLAFNQSRIPCMRQKTSVDWSVDRCSSVI